MLAGRYRLESRLGQGAMGIVWRARDEALGRDVAIKELLTPDDLDEGRRRAAARRMLREARSAALLRHPAIITVHDVVEQDGRPWIVMELLSGRSLEQEEPMPPARAARIGLEVLDALRAAHARGVQHRDVKPANIFLRDDGRAILTDFGIASLEGDVSLTRTGALIGSPAYMAPERVRGESGGPASDLWSLGATLYALVEGRTPFDRATVMGMLGAVLTDPPAPPRAAGPLGPVLLALLAKDPAVRLDAERARAALLAVSGGGDPVPPAQFALPPPIAHAPTLERGPGPRPGLPPNPSSSRSTGGSTGRSSRRSSRRSSTVPSLAASAAVVFLIAVAALVVALVVATKGERTNAGSEEGGRGPTGSRRTGGPAAARSTDPAPRFTAAPDACGLVAGEEATRLIHGPFFSHRDIGDGEDACTWSTSTGTPVGEPQYSLNVTARLVRPGATALPPVAGAHAAFAQRRAVAAPRGGTPDPARPFRNLSGLGDEAFLVEAPDASGGAATVVVRVSNLILEVEYRARDVRGAQDGLRTGAQRAARSAVPALPR